MKSLIAFLAIIGILFAPLIEAQRVGGAISEYQLLKSDCLNEGPFPNTRAGTGGSLVSIAAARTFLCPQIVFNSVTFANAANGITRNPSAVASGSGVKSNAAIDTTQLTGGDMSFEFWVLLTPTNPSERVLFEISQDASGVGVTNWVLGTNYDFRISVTGSDLFVSYGGVEEKVGLLAALGSTSTAIRHLVVKISPGIAGTSVVAVHIDGNAPTTISVSRPPNLTFAATNNRVYMLGGSFDQKSTVPGVASLAYTEDIYFFSIYALTLSNAQVLQNFQANPPPSTPTVVTAIAFNHIEDLATTFNLGNRIFDFDNAFFGSTTNLNIRFVNGPQRGRITRNGNNINFQSTLDDENSDLQYLQNTQNDDSGTDTFTFFVFEGNNQAVASQTATVTFTYLQSNDPPVATVNNVKAEVAEGQLAQVSLLATDPFDSGNGKDQNNLPNRFRINSFTTTVGTWVDCTNQNPIVENQEFTNVVASQGNTVFTATVCFRADTFENEVDALIGTDIIRFTVLDGGNLVSANVGTSQIDVLNALSAGCRFLDPADCVEEISELADNAFTTVTLVGFDSKCDGDVVDPACTTPGRPKIFKIAEPLPNPVTEGELRVLVEGVEVTLTDAVMDANQGEFTIPNNGNTVRFYPVSGYFNRAQFPQCIVTNFGSDTRGQCANTNNGSGQVCTGSFCESLTTATTRQVIGQPDEIFRYGSCGSSPVIDGGCPVRIFHRLFIGQGGSPFNAADPPTHVIWVNNVRSNDGPQIKIVPDPDDETFEGFGPFDKVTRRVSNNNPIQVIDPDGDAKNIEVALSNPGENAVLNIVLDENKDKNDPFYFFAEAQIINGIKQNPLSMRGIPSKLNQVLRKLDCSLPGELNGNIVLALRSPNRANGVANDDQVVFTLPFDAEGVNSNPQNFVAQYKEFLAIAAFVVLLVLFILFYCIKKGCDCACGCYEFGKLFYSKKKRDNAKLRRGRQSMDSEEEERLRKAKFCYKVGVCCYLFRIPFLVVCCCPCLFEMREKRRDHEENEDALDIQEKGLKSAEPVNPDDWEQQEKVGANGQVKVMWKNKQTGKIQWNNPFGQREKLKDKLAYKETLESGPKVFAFKLFKGDGKKKKNRRDSESSVDSPSVNDSSRRNNKIQSRRGAPKGSGRGAAPKPLAPTGSAPRGKSEDAPKSKRAKFKPAPPSGPGPKKKEAKGPWSTHSSNDSGSGGLDI